MYVTFSVLMTLAIMAGVNALTISKYEIAFSKNMASNKTVIKSLTTSSIRCSAACNLESSCGGFNFKRVPRPRCDLIGGRTNARHISVEDGVTFYAKQDGFLDTETTTGLEITTNVEVLTTTADALTTDAELLTTSVFTTTGNTMMKDCNDVMLSGQTTSGVFTIYPESTVTQSRGVYCDMVTDGGGWTVLLRRQDGTESFERMWADYKNGFGISSGEFWAGNDLMYQMTSSSGLSYRLRIDMTSFRGEKRYASYSHFVVNAESENYRLNIRGYSGNATDSFSSHNNDEFTTPDRDHDTMRPYNCGERYHNGWWYHDCSNARLTGLYGEDVPDDQEWMSTYYQGIMWDSWLGINNHPQFVEMKIKPI